MEEGMVTVYVRRGKYGRYKPVLKTPMTSLPERCEVVVVRFDGITLRKDDGVKLDMHFCRRVK